jgi:Zn-dependent peptidase ImmA (M78 family)
MNVEAQARAAATAFRAKHHLGTQPLGDLVALIEQTTGMDVAVLPVEPDEHGLTMRDPVRDAVMIAVAQTPHPMRQRSTLAHELAHVVFEDWSDFPDIAPPESAHERRATSFARHLLLPLDGVRDMVDVRSADLADLSRVVQLFGVSPAMAAIAMKSTGVINEDTKTQWMTLSTSNIAARFGWLDHYRLLQQQSRSPRPPQKLLGRLTVGYVENVVSAQTIATLRGQSVDVVVSELENQGITPRPRRF